jgi:hypothetical protein
MLHARSIDLLELLVGFVKFEYTLPLMPDYDMFVPVLGETFALGVITIDYNCVKCCSIR